LVSWPQYADKTHGSYPVANFFHQRSQDYLKTIAVDLSNLFPDSKGFMSNINEWGVMNWDPVSKGISSGEYLAEVIRMIEDDIRQVRPQAEIYVWSDMYDPYMNAIKSYYLVNGSLEGSWKGVLPETIIMNWGMGKRAKKSLLFWNGSDPDYPIPHHKQILADYYDNPQSIVNRLQALDDAEASGQITDVIGVMYCTWTANSDGTAGDFSQLKDFKDKIVAAGRWGA